MLPGIHTPFHSQWTMKVHCRTAFRAGKPWPDSSHFKDFYFGFCLFFLNSYSVRLLFYLYPLGFPYFTREPYGIFLVFSAQENFLPLLIVYFLHCSIFLFRWPQLRYQCSFSVLLGACYQCNGFEDISYTDLQGPKHESQQQPCLSSQLLRSNFSLEKSMNLLLIMNLRFFFLKPLFTILEWLSSPLGFSSHLVILPLSEGSSDLSGFCS